MAKKLEDWTLKEAQSECKQNTNCYGCPFYNKNDHCRIKGYAELFDLTEEPTFTVAEMQFLEMLNNNGAMFLVRDKNKNLYWFDDCPKKNDNTWHINLKAPQTKYGMLPETMFPQVQWSDDSPLSIEELLSYGK